MPSVQSKLAKKARPVHASRPPAPGSRGARKLAERLAPTPDAASRPAAAATQARSADGSTAGPALTPQRLAAPVAMPPLDPVRAAESELTKWLALDCEMVGVGPRGSKSALAQVAIVNAIFAPSLEEIELAKRQIQAFEMAAEQGLGVAVVDGKIVENLHVKVAQATLAKAVAITELEVLR